MKMQRVRNLGAVALFIGSASTAAWATPLCTGVSTFSLFDSSLTISYEFDPAGRTVSSAPAAFAGGAVLFGVYVPASCCEQFAFDGIAVADPTAGAADLTQQSISGQSSNDPRNALGLIATQSFFLSLQTGSMSSWNSTGSRFSVVKLYDGIPCTDCGTEFELQAAMAFGSQTIVWNLTPGTARPTIVPTVSLQLAYEGISVIANPGIYNLCFGRGEDVRSPSLVGVQFFSSDTTVAGPGGSQTAVTQGVIAAYSDGTTRRLGALGTPIFAPVPNANGWSINGSLAANTPPIPNDATSLSFRPLGDFFRDFNGDINRDRKVCRADSVAFDRAFGSSIGVAAYTARADFNLDGQIDANDRTAFDAFRCDADFDCDGTVSINDFFAFLSAYANGAIEADMDNNNVIDVTDHFLWLTAYANGC